MRNHSIYIILSTFVFLNLFLNAFSRRYSECGESPVQKYRELAKTIGKIYIYIFFLMLYFKGSVLKYEYFKIKC